jgi:hypothetical protein
MVDDTEFKSMASRSPSKAWRPTEFYKLTNWLKMLLVGSHIQTDRQTDVHIDRHNIYLKASILFLSQTKKGSKEMINERNKYRINTLKDVQRYCLRVNHWKTFRRNCVEI